jgi:hypothetical protein
MIGIAISLQCFANSKSRCITDALRNLVENSTGIPEKLINSPIIVRYWDDQDVNTISNAILSRKRIETFRNPFRLSMKSQKLDDVLLITISTLAGREHVIPFLNITFLDRRSTKFDSSLPKLITAIMKAAAQSKTHYPDLRYLIVEAPSLMNTELIEVLRDLGFKDFADPGFWKTRAIGAHSPLQLKIELK